MTSTNTGVSLLVISVVLLAGCSKSLTHSESDRTLPTSTFTSDSTQSPFYGDSILYVQGTGRAAYLFSPVNSLENGVYVSWPKGLVIDPHSGVIDVLESETGSRYNVGFVNAATGDTAYRQVVLAGATYPDGIYDLSSPDSTLRPYYNASSTASWKSNAIFDAETGGGMGANDHKLNVNTANGVINLAKSLREGLFGSNPVNGDTRTIPIYYRLNDQSHMNLLKASVQVYYYHTIADVPQALVAACQYSQQAFAQTTEQNEKTTAATAPVSTGPAVKTVAPPAPTPPRPPLVIIVNVGHK